MEKGREVKEDERFRVWPCDRLLQPSESAGGENAATEMDPVICERNSQISTSFVLTGRSVLRIS